jgi:hypothetical protein
MQAGPGLPDEASNANQPKGQVPGGAGGDFAAGISGSVCVNHLWPVVAGGGVMTKDEALKLALEALEKSVATCFDRYAHEQVMSRPEHFINQAITAIKQALAAQQEHEPENEPYVSLASAQEPDAAALFREALAFGLAYGPEIPAHQWDEMREEKVAQLVTRLATPPAAQPAPVQDLPFGVGGGLVAIKTLLSRDPCVHANTAIEMIDAILKEHPAAQPAPVQPVAWRAWFDADNGARWLFSLWPEEERLDVEWQPLFTSPPAQPALVQEPVAWIDCKVQMPPPGVRVFFLHKDYDRVGFDTWCGDDFRWTPSHWMPIPPLTTTPPAHPAVPDALTSADIQENIEYVAGWNDCRQAMMEMMK